MWEACHRARTRGLLRCTNQLSLLAWMSARLRSGSSSGPGAVCRPAAARARSSSVTAAAGPPPRLNRAASKAANRSGLSSGPLLLKGGCCRCSGWSGTRLGGGPASEGPAPAWEAAKRVTLRCQHRCVGLAVCKERCRQEGRAAAAMFTACGPGKLVRLLVCSHAHWELCRTCPKMHELSTTACAPAPRGI